MKKVWLLVGMLCFQSYAVEILNVGIRVNLEYSDLDTHCRLSQVLEHYRFSAELENETVITAQLKKQSPSGHSIAYKFSESELRQIEVRKDKGLTWLKKLPAASDLIAILFKTGEGFGRDSCVPPQEVATFYPNSFDYDFGVEEVGYLLPTLIHSDEVTFRGQNVKNQNYQIRMSLTQDRR